jgi:hypothetical protein
MRIISHGAFLKDFTIALVTIFPVRDPSRRKHSFRIIGAWRILERCDNRVDYNTACKRSFQRDMQIEGSTPDRP